MEKTFLINGTEVKVQDFESSGDRVSFKLKGRTYDYSLIKREGAELILERGPRLKAFVGSPNRDGECIVVAGGREALVSGAGKRTKRSGSQVGGLTSPMPGKIFKVLKTVGSEVKKGEAILILEAMKMEHSIRADKDGKVKSINYQVGELVQGGVNLAELE